MQTTEFIWFDGKLVPWNEAQVHVLTHALHYGSAVFEGIRAYKCADGTSAVFRLQEHAQRLINSGKILRLEIPYTAEQIADGIIETLKANKLAEGYIRPLSFVGLGEMGVYPGNNPVNTIIAVWSWGAYLGPEALEQGIGTLGEKRLHAVLKRYYQPDDNLHDRKIGRMVADAVLSDGSILEIQTQSFSSLQKKLPVFLACANVHLIAPVVQKKWVCWLNPETGEMVFYFSP